MLIRPQQLVLHDQWTWNIEKYYHKYYHHCVQFGKCARLFPFKWYIMSIGMFESQQHWLVHETWWFIASYTSCTYWKCLITELIWLKSKWICLFLKKRKRLSNKKQFLDGNVILFKVDEIKNSSWEKFNILFSIIYACFHYFRILLFLCIWLLLIWDKVNN